MFGTVRSSTSASGKEAALLGCYGSDFKYAEFQVMSSITSVIIYTMALAFGVGMLLVSPVSQKTMRRLVLFFSNFFFHY